MTVAAGAAGEWRTLFDGKTSAGWLEITGKPFPATWTVEDGCLKTSPKPGGMQDIRTVDVFRNFELEFDWKMLADGNSGVKYLVQKVDEWTNKDGRQARARGLEYQLADDHNPDAASDPARVAGSLYSVIAPVPKITPKIGEFNHSRLVVNGGHVEHWLNGTKVVEFSTGDAAVQKQLRTLRGKDGELLEEGPISLQNHSSEVWFRGIRVRTLRK
uniref:3-keto-alpha-glucoside-1,2-lyase/3-keto-2-hydroxy-glucal hydratase domain-containing protein n=1 Tax=Solibacter usitatus (strain Ellin6076) TaxID=234267 RepID=Q024G0_SOLUE